MLNFFILFRESYSNYYDWDRTRSIKQNEVKLEKFSKIIDNTLPSEEYLDEKGLKHFNRLAHYFINMDNNN